MYSRAFDESPPVLPENYKGTAFEKASPTQEAPPEKGADGISPDGHAETSVPPAEETIETAAIPKKPESPPQDHPCTIDQEDLLLLLIVFLLLGKNVEEIPLALLMLLAAPDQKKVI